MKSVRLYREDLECRFETVLGCPCVLDIRERPQTAICGTPYLTGEGRRATLGTNSKENRALLVGDLSK